MFTEKPTESPENTRDSRKNETVIFDKNGRCELMQFNKKYKQTANVIDFSVRMTIMKLVNRTAVAIVSLTLGTYKNIKQRVTKENENIQQTPKNQTRKDRPSQMKSFVISENGGVLK